MNDLTSKQLRKAADIKDKIDALQDQLSKLLGGSSNGVATGRRGRTAAKTTSAKPVKRGRRKMSAAAKARLSAMAKARWKKAKAQGKKSL